MKVGQIVFVMDMNGNELLRLVIAVENGFVYVARPEEVEDARTNFREPNCIGFLFSDVRLKMTKNKA